MKAYLITYRSQAKDWVCIASTMGVAEAQMKKKFPKMEIITIALLSDCVVVSEFYNSPKESEG